MRIRQVDQGPPSWPTSSFKEILCSPRQPRSAGPEPYEWFPAWPATARLPALSPMAFPRTEAGYPKKVALSHRVMSLKTNSSRRIRSRGGQRSHGHSAVSISGPLLMPSCPVEALPSTL